MATQFIGNSTAVLTRLSDWLKWEEDDRYSRKEVTVAASQTLLNGAVVGVNAAGEVGEYDDVDPNFDVAVGILCEDVTTGAGETRKSVIVCRQAKIIEFGLKWKSGLGGTAKTNARNDLAALGIVIAREA